MLKAPLNGGLSQPPEARGSQPLADWLVQFTGSASYAGLVERLKVREHITPPEETAAIYGLLQEIKPRSALEIGTFFARTTRIMAEAIVERGIDAVVTTLDPFGAARVPGILRSWPRRLQAVTAYKPWNSMQYFLDLETAGQPRGAASPLGLVFVDGHHTFEYVLFDIMRSADHLAPEGVIVVDNLEQEGPRSAVAQFLRWNPAWKLFQEGAISSAVDGARDLSGSNREEPCWGVLFAPPGLQVSAQASKLTKRDLPYKPLEQIQFNVCEVSQPGTLHLNLSYFAVPFNFHLTGTGMTSERIILDAPVQDASPIALTISPPATLDLPRTGSYVCYEAELTFHSADASGYLLLDAHDPLQLLSGSR
ncbi:MAG: class I SAM-dependent methyltransferase [Chloroflexi bacterium]|nr:class I SAM-dependent methyltransferase [Chloroflexota bacterium]